MSSFCRRHSQETDYQDSKISKLFVVQMISSFTGLAYAQPFTERDGYKNPNLGSLMQERCA